MVHFTGGFLLFSALSLAAPQDRPQRLQHPLQVPAQKDGGERPSPRKLHGRFLHITDLHPDPFYQTHTSTGGGLACHSGSGPAGPYGAELSNCDSPFSLVNATFRWIDENLKDMVDFVVWTGDSARHDNDENHPRTENEVVDLNEYIVQKFVEVFGKDDNIDDRDPTNDFVVPIIPTFGNNDILPHNIFQAGPNTWTHKYSTIWARFVPEEQRHSFARGGWFFTEVIPNKLAVFSINTLYFFDSNSAVDGCDAESEPGYEHMEWLRIQLQFLRDRGMKAILTGHVPPARTKNKATWDESCWQKWTLWMRQYRDVVVGTIFGHINIDHFMVADVKELEYDFNIEGLDLEHFHADVSGTEDDKASEEEYEQTHPHVEITQSGRRGKDLEFHTQAKSQYLNELREAWASLPTPPDGLSYSTISGKEYSTFLQAPDTIDSAKMKKKPKKSKKQKQKEKFLEEIGGAWAERFSVGITSPSVVPNFYPTLRVIEYNISGLEELGPANRAAGRVAKHEETMVQDRCLVRALGQITSERHAEVMEAIDSCDDHQKFKASRDMTIEKKKKKKKKPEKPSFPVPKPPAKTAPPGPAYSPQTLTFLGFTQYYANLTKINAAADDAAKMGQDAAKFGYEVEYDTRNDSVYSLTDLTVRQWVGMAEKMGRKSSSKNMGDWGADPDTGPSPNIDEELEAQKKKKKKKKKKKDDDKHRSRLWRTFVSRVFVNTKSEEELDNDFGR